MRRPPLNLLLALAALALLLVDRGLPSRAQGRASGRSPLNVAPSGGSDCISAEHRAMLTARIRAYELRKYGGPVRPYAAEPALYPFYPLAGNIGGDLYTNNYVDLDTTAGLRDWGCQERTYNGHTGHDTSWFLGGTWEPMEVGWPIFAALDGVVADAHDGEFDRNTTAAGQPANYVVLDHGGGHYSLYWHMKNGSVAVSTGQTIRAGAQLGLVASSGNSTGPHLHFESHFNAAHYEPFAGGCRSGKSFWVSQPVPPTHLRLTQARVTRDSTPTAAIVQSNDAQLVGLLYSLGDLPANSSSSLVYRRPDGSVAFTGSFNHNNGSAYAVSNWFAHWWVTFSTPGTWTIDLVVNGQKLGSAPLEVVASAAQVSNRPPARANLAFDPPRPTPGDVVFCRIQDSTAFRDPESELIRYQYVWRVNGVSVRQVTSAAMSDAIPHSLVKYGDTLSCSVTPSDGALSGPSSTVERVIGGSVSGTVTLSGQALAGVTVSLGQYSAVTGADGKYRIQGVPLGTYTATPSKTDYTFTPATRSVQFGADAANVDFAATFAPTIPAPTGLTVTPLSATQIRVSWNDPAADETGFQLDRRTATSGWSARTLLPNTKSVTDESLTPGTTYWYRIRTLNAGRASAYTPEVQGTTWAAPGAPTGLTATLLSATQAKLSWTDNAGTELSYRVERRLGAGAWAQVADLAKNIVTWTDAGLTTAKSYSYRVRAASGTSFSAYSNVVTLYAGAPPVPTGLAAVALSATQIRVSWTNNSVYESGFRLERRTAASGWTARLLPADTTSFQEEGLLPATLYRFRILAVNGSLSSTYSTEVGATTWTAPSAPSGLKAAVISATQVRLNWAHTGTTETGFRVERRKGAGVWTEVAALGKDVLTWTDAGAAPGSPYSYRVRAVSGTRFSAYSNTASVYLGVPAAPTGLAAAALSATQLRITWGDPSSFETGFALERRTDGSAWSVRTLPANTTSLQDENLLPTTRYYYRLRAFNGGAYSPYSATVSAVTWAIPAAPTALTATVLSATQVRLNWSHTGATETGFRVERRLGSGAWVEIKATAANVVSYTDTTTVGKQTYSYRVRAASGARFSAYSNTATARTP